MKRLLIVLLALGIALAIAQSIIFLMDHHEKPIYDHMATVEERCSALANKAFPGVHHFIDVNYDTGECWAVPMVKLPVGNK